MLLAEARMAWAKVLHARLGTVSTVTLIFDLTSEVGISLSATMLWHQRNKNQKLKHQQRIWHLLSIRGQSVSLLEAELGATVPC